MSERDIIGSTPTPNNKVLSWAQASKHVKDEGSEGSE
jgi:hypothetical protein